MKINMNAVVRVEVNEYGVEILKKHFGIFTAALYPDLKEGTVIKSQLWEVMSIFGPYIKEGRPGPFGEIETL